MCLSTWRCDWRTGEKEGEVILGREGEKYKIRLDGGSRVKRGGCVLASSPV